MNVYQRYSYDKRDIINDKRLIHYQKGIKERQRYIHSKQNVINERPLKIYL